MNPESAALFQNTLYAIVALLSVIAVYTLVSPLLEGDKLKKRMSSVADAREGMRKARMDSLAAERGLRGDNKGLAKKAVDALSLEKLLEASDLKDKLAQAGLRGQRPIYLFYFARLILPIGFGLFGLVFFILINANGMPLQQGIAWTVFAVAAGYYLPAIYLKNSASKRLKSIMPVFPDALDLLLICVESGMSLEASMKKVAIEIGLSSPALAEELTLTTAELSYLQERRQAHENLAKRTGLDQVKAVTMALIQAERYGTPLSTALRALSQESRDMRMAEAEKKAAGLPPKLTVPMIVFFLPVLFAVIIGPAIIQINAQ